MIIFKRKKLFIGVVLLLCLQISAGTAFARISNQELHTIRNNHFNGIYSPTVKIIKVGTTPYYFILVLVNDPFNDRVLVNRRLKSRLKRSLFRYLNKKHKTNIIEIKSFMPGMQWKDGKHYFELAYIKVDDIKLNANKKQIKKEQKGSSQTKIYDAVEIKEQTVSLQTIDEESVIVIKAIENRIKENPTSIPLYTELKEIYKTTGNIDKVSEITDKIMELKFSQ